MGRLRINRTEASDMLRDPETYMLTVFITLMATYGDDVLAMDPLEIYALIGDDFNADPPIQIENRINAGLTCIPNDAFYTDIRVFSAVCNCLYTGDLGDDILLDPVTLPEIIWAVYEMELLRGVEDEPEFSPQILSFIKRVAAMEAVDVDDVDDLDTLRLAFVGEAVQELSTQLQRLGLKEEEIYEALQNQEAGSFISG